MSAKLKKRTALAAVLLLSTLIISGCNEDDAQSSNRNNPTVLAGAVDPGMEPIHAPEPLSAALFGIGVAAVALARKKRRRS